MSLSTQTKIRLPKIKKGLLQGLSSEEIGIECGVTEKTIDRDKQAWYESGDFEVWLRAEWVRYHILVGHMDPVEVYRQLTKLVGKQIAQRIAVTSKEEVKLEIVAPWLNKFSSQETNTNPTKDS